MDAGVDDWLEHPVDGRLLKLKLENLVRRYDPERDRLASAVPQSQPACDEASPISTHDPAVLLTRLQREASRCDLDGVAFAVVLLKKPLGAGYRTSSRWCASTTWRSTASRMRWSCWPKPARLGWSGSRSDCAASRSPILMAYRCFDGPGAGGEALSVVGEWVGDGALSHVS